MDSAEFNIPRDREALAQNERAAVDLAIGRTIAIAVRVGNDASASIAQAATGSAPALHSGHWISQAIQRPPLDGEPKRFASLTTRPRTAGTALVSAHGTAPFRIGQRQSRVCVLHSSRAVCCQSMRAANAVKRFSVAVWLQLAGPPFPGRRPGPGVRAEADQPRLLALVQP